MSTDVLRVATRPWTDPVLVKLDYDNKINEYASTALLEEKLDGKFSKANSNAG